MRRYRNVAHKRTTLKAWLRLARIDLGYFVLSVRQRVIGPYCAKYGHAGFTDNYRHQGYKWYFCARCHNWVTGPKG